MTRSSVQARGMHDGRRMTEERVPDDIDTSAMILLSGEFELVDDDATPSKEELASARRARHAPKLFALAVVMLAGGGLLARRHVPKLDAELDAIAAAMRPAPLPTPALTPTLSPIAMSDTSSATLTVVPKMQEPSPPPVVAEPAKKAAAKVNAKSKRPAARH